MKILNSESYRFDKILNDYLLSRKNKIKINSAKVKSIIEDVKRNGDKAVLKFEKRFSKNNIIIPSKKEISNTIFKLDKKIKKAIDLAYKRIYKFHSLQKFILYRQI